MQRSIARDKDGSLVISEALVEQLTLGKIRGRENQGLIIEDGRLHIDLIDVQSLEVRDERCDAAKAVQMIAEKIREGCLHFDLGQRSPEVDDRGRAMGRELAEAIDHAVKEGLRRETRPGGMLHRGGARS